MIEKIIKKIDDLESFLKELEEDVPENFKTYLQNKRKYERLLHLCIEASSDICVLIHKSENLGIPSDEDTVFDKLAEENIISKTMKTKLHGIRGLRNVLIHRYDKLDDELVFKNLKENRKDFHDFLREIKDYLKRKS